MIDTHLAELAALTSTKLCAEALQTTQANKMNERTISPPDVV